MKGSLKTKPALNQFLFLFGVTLASFFILGAIGGLAISISSGISISELTEIDKLDLSRPEVINLLRGLQVVQFVSLFLVPVLICSWFLTDNRKKYLGLKWPANAGYILAGVGIMLIAIPFTSWLGELNGRISLPTGIENWMQEQEKQAERTIKALLSRRSISDLLLNIFCIAVLAAVGEELLFRGMVQRILIRLFRSPWAGIIVTAIIFSAMHMQFYGFLPRLMLGILLGVIFWYSGSLWVAILAHFIYDAVIIILAYFNPEMLDEKNKTEFNNLAMAGMVSLAVVVLLIIWMKKRSTVTYEQVYATDNIPVKNHPFDFDQNTPS
jgi:uncharacterized protein